MLASSGSEIPPALRILAEASARLYPEFAHELEEGSGAHVDLREQGTILISEHGEFPESAEPLSLERLLALEPGLAAAGRRRSALPTASVESSGETSAAYLSERSVDPPGLVAAAIKAAHHRRVHISSGNEVQYPLTANNRVAGVQTDQTSYAAPAVVNCAGAWAGGIGPHRFPVRPVKGQMPAAVGGPRLKHVVRAVKVYLTPRSTGGLIIGSILPSARYNKHPQ